MTRNEQLGTTQSYQPQSRALRYDNMRSARAEAGLIRLLLMDDSLFPTPFPLTPRDFSSPVLRKAFFTLWDAKLNGHALSVALLSGALTSEEMSVVVTEYSKPESAADAAQALSDYIRVIREECDKRTPDAQEDKLTKLTRKYEKQKNKGGMQT